MTCTFERFTVNHREEISAECRYCHAPISHVEDVGWVDVRGPYYGGTYDMCDRVFSGQHEPVHDPYAVKAQAHEAASQHRIFAANYAADMLRRSRS